MTTPEEPGPSNGSGSCAPEVGTRRCGWIPRVARTDRVLRPFWLHQSAEYLIGLVIVAMGLQSIEPTVPTIAGGVVLLNAALVDGPLGAFRLFSRKAHRIVDAIVIAGLALIAVLPFLDVDTATRIILGGAAGVLGVVWWNSAFEKRPSRAARRAGPPTGSTAQPVDRSEAFGRGAGRLAGGIAKAVRDRSKAD